MRPTRADFVAALGKAEALQFVDPCKQLLAWACVLHRGTAQVGFGLGDTPGEAAAFAWLVLNDPDILIDGKPDPASWVDADPYEPPGDYRFEIEPPWTARPAFWVLDTDDEGGELE